jgi:hypothetical protein
MNAMLGKVISSHQRDWDEVLPHVLAAYRASLHEATGFTPNYLMFGRETRAPIDLVYGRPPDADRRAGTYSTYVQDFAERVESAYRLVREHLRVSAERRKKKYDLKVRPAAFAPGDRVWYYTPRRYQGRSPKWARMYTGPFYVMEQTGPVNYRLRRTRNSKPFIAHIDKLRPSYDDSSEETGGAAAPIFDSLGPSAAMPSVSEVDDTERRPKRTVRLPARYR